MGEEAAEALDYKRTLNTSASSERAYNAVTSEFGAWWTDPNATLARIGDIATFRFPPNQSTWTFRPKTLEPHKLVEHECVGANHLHEGLPDSVRTEWLGTILRFEIKATEAGSVIDFRHCGLKPSLDCYEVCSAGWEFYFMDSLRAYLIEGIGKPHG